MDLKEMVRRNNQYLVDNLRPEIVSQHLFAKKIFSHEELERINDEPTSAAKSSHLLRTLWRKGANGFKEFFNALDTTEQSGIRTHLERSSDKDELIREHRREQRDVCQACGQAVPSSTLTSLSKLTLKSPSQSSQVQFGRTKVENEAGMRERIRLLEKELKNEVTNARTLQSRCEAFENEKDKQTEDLKKKDEKHKTEIHEMKKINKHSEDDLTSLRVDCAELRKTVSDLQQKNEDCQQKMGAYKVEMEAKYQKLIEALEAQSSTSADILSIVAAIKSADSTTAKSSSTPSAATAISVPEVVSESDLPVYTVGKSGSSPSRSVSCTPMTLDTERVGGNLLVSEDGLELENTERRGQTQGETGSLSEYKGTCSRLLFHLPPSPCTPRYWETHSRVKVGRVLGWGWPLLEMALCQEGEVDTGVWISEQTRNSWAVRNGDCDTHYPGICTRVYREGEQVGGCWSNTMSDAPGTTAMLKYGIVLDVGRGRLAFLDLNRGIVLSNFNLQFTESLRPMFGVWPSPFYTVQMRLVSGGEITMTDTKKDLICQALSTT